ncbi:MAG: type IV pilus modification protein PilV [Aquabacterium sp.]|nr:type IV pilus modification protein PilV [Aquabacterium sp.]
MRTARPPFPARHAASSVQGGVMLLEAMVAILIFSLGVLSVIQLQAVSIRQASSAEYRSMASMLANDLVSRMWASNRAPDALQASFSSTSSGSGYTQWLATVRRSGLPNISNDQGTLPTVTFTSVPAGVVGGTASSQATVTIYWKEQGDTTRKRSYQVVAQIK